MATGTVKQVVKRGSSTLTLDAIGRVLIPVPNNNLLNVIAQNTAYVCLPRYAADGTSTLVYVYDLTTMRLVTTRPTVTFTYLYY